MREKKKKKKKKKKNIGFGIVGRQLGRTREADREKEDSRAQVAARKTREGLGLA